MKQSAMIQALYFLRAAVAATACLILGQGVYQVSVAAPSGPKPTADFSRFVVVGDSLAAGVQNFSLNENYQPNSYAALIAKQAGANLPLPLIAAPGVPPPLELESIGPPPVVVPGSGISTGRRDPLLQPYNISVPNLKINEFLNYRPDCFADQTVGGIRLVDVYVELVLGLPGCLSGQLRSEMEMAEYLQPSFAILWIGNNDTLWAVVNGVTSEITEENVFRSAYEETVQRLLATGTQLVIGNLPDPTLTPHLTSAEKLAAMLGQPLSDVGPILGIGAGDYVTLSGINYLVANGIGPLPATLVVSSTEIEEIQTANLLFNSIIYEIAAQHSIPVVDIRGLLQEIYENGIVIEGQRLSLEYLGGIFTLDGFHPTNTGHAIVANKFIKTINRYFKVSIPLVDIKAVKETDPLVFPETGRPPSSL